MIKQTKPWWQNSVVYQIYPKSFQSTNAQSQKPATGDLKGIIKRLDYLAKLGIDAIWLTPIYPSPQVDNGYDISEYCAINPDYGTLSDFDELVRSAHQKGIKIMMDMVFNHTSDKHPWFQAALDKNSPYRSFYIWKEAKINELGQKMPPNNWLSKFGGSAWEWHDESNQYYLHLFAKEQPDLNWENPVVRAQVQKVVQFWSNRGVDALRLDVINLISKDQGFPDDLTGDGRRYYTDGPKIHDYLQEMTQSVFNPNHLVTVGEMSSTSLENCIEYANLNEKELSMVFNFHHLKVDYPNGEKWTKAAPDFLELKSIFNHWQQGMHGKAWLALFWCNHDQPRIASRFGHEGQYRVESAKLWAMILHGMQGTPYIYQGEEIGMLNPNFDSISQYKDIESINMFHEMQSKGLSEKEILAILAQKSRDNSRTPMQWDQTQNAGFSIGDPWISVAKNYLEINVESTLLDPHSIFYCYQTLIQLRKKHPVFAQGSYQDLTLMNDKKWIYQRVYQDQILTVYANLTDQTIELENAILGGFILLNNYDETPDKINQLKPYQAIYTLTQF